MDQPRRGGIILVLGGAAGAAASRARAAVAFFVGRLLDSDRARVCRAAVCDRRVAAADPDVVLAPTEPYAFKPFHLDVLRQLAPVVEVDGQDLFWWGVRTPAAQRRLRDAIGAALSG